MKNPKLTTLLREPLLHFLLIGAALFLFYNLQNEGRIDNNRIVISEAQINHLVTLWNKKRQRPPTQIELEGMIKQQVREEIMVREALAMGLDKNDSIIRRRLAQKIEFITSDLAALAEPGETELSNYLSTHSEQFSLPARIDFAQVFINPEKRGVDTDEYASNLLSELTQADSNRDITTLGDSLMLEQKLEQVTEHDVSRLFGKDFASELFILPVGSWQGTIQSGYGLHLVRVSNKTENQLPELNAVREKVLAEWQAQQRQDMDKVFYESLHQRYEIVIEK
ncbi:MAG: peptidyl-prolyl cis-trans isomerase [Gammaproteobacteria bacterium]|nr:peptidyl-prolyl cis-trans isomerase [Gammaproteobacteria bacterium]